MIFPFLFWTSLYNHFRTKLNYIRDSITLNYERLGIAMPDWVQTILTFAGVIIGSGLIQFFINRKDSKKDRIDKFCDKIEKSLLEHKEISEKEYEELNNKMIKGLEEREATGRERFMHHEAAYKELSEAIIKLTEHDEKQHKYMKYMGEELMGLAHDRLVTLTDSYQLRGAITLKEKATLEAIFKPYHEGLGGNGDGEQGYKYAMSLPVVTDDQAREMDSKRR